MSTASGSPPPFFWGVATSAFQHEGGFNGPNQPLNNWVWAERENRVETSGDSADFWHRAPEDFARCRALGLNAFRLGLSWARIQPATALGSAGRAPAPAFDRAALDHYAGMIAACHRAGLEPIITLQHFTHPAWLGPDAWLEEETIDLFLAFVRETLRHLLAVLPRDHDCPPPRWFITINEPNMLASCTYLSGTFPAGPVRGPRHFTTCLGHLLEAHVRAYHLVHSLYAATPVRPQVAFNNYCSDLYWNDQAWLDLMFAHARQVPRGRLFSHLWEQAWRFDQEFDRAALPIRPWLRRQSGEIIKKVQHFLAYACSFDTAWGRLVDLIYQHPRAPLDYLAIDYYDPFAAHALRWPAFHDQFGSTKDLHERLLDSVTSKWWDWRLLPEGLAFFVRTLRRFDLPVLIAENGMAQHRPTPDSATRRRDNLQRDEYIRQHVRVTTQLRREGHRLMGYLYWSLTDNYEWGTYAARFGLFPMERAGTTPAAQAYAEAIAEARREFP